MAVFITGDTHIPHDIKKLTSSAFPEGKTLCKDDVLIVCGDFGLIWNNVCDNEEKYWTKWLDNKPWTTLFIDGNHENHERLSRLKTVKKYGAKIGIVSDSIFHLKRGKVYIIQGKKFWCMGGALSVDKMHRTEGISWWREEKPSCADEDNGLNNLKKHDNKVDYLVTHTLPLQLRNQLTVPTYMGDKWYDSTCKYLDHIYNTVEFNRGYCGHWHMDCDVKRYTILYQDILKIF